MAVWGAPTAHEDDAERAVRAALELVDAVPALGAGDPGARRRPDRRGGGHARRHEPGDGRRRPRQHRQPAAVGRRRRAPSSSARRRIARRRSAIAFEAAGEQALKGKAARCRPGGRCGSSRERGGRNRADALEAPFVGRDDELRLLKDLFHATGREQRPRLVSVIGPAGIGKTRLAWEFVKYLDGLVETVCWHDGRSPGLRRGDHLLGARRDGPRPRGLLETRRRGDDPGEGRARRSPSTSPTRRSGAGSSRALLALLGRRVGRSAARAALRARGARSSSGSPSEGPVVMVFEDFHCGRLRACSTSSTTCSTGAADVPIFVVTLARPELLERRPDWGAGKRNLRVAVPRAARRRGDARAARRPRPGPARRGRRGRSWRAPTGSRSTPSRRSGCSSPTGGSPSRTAPTGRSGDLDQRWPCRRRSRR